MNHVHLALVLAVAAPASPMPQEAALPLGEHIAPFASGEGPIRRALENALRAPAFPALTGPSEAAPRDEGGEIGVHRPAVAAQVSSQHPKGPSRKVYYLGIAIIIVVGLILALVG